MSSESALRRLRRLEIQTGPQSFEPRIRELAAEMTEELGEDVDPDDLLAHAKWMAQREREVGWEQTVAEVEAEEGFEPGELWARLAHSHDRDGPHE